MWKSDKVAGTLERREYTEGRSYHRWQEAGEWYHNSVGTGGYEVGEVIEEANGIVGKVGTDSKMLACPHCDSAKSYRYGRAKKRRVLHGRSQSERIYLEIVRHRWRCCHCGYSFTEGIELVRVHSRSSAQDCVDGDAGAPMHNDYSSLP